MLLDEVGHASIDRMNDRVRRIVQRVVEVEEPDQSAVGGRRSADGVRELPGSGSLPTSVMKTLPNAQCRLPINDF
jgi:hypothetical protein